MARAFRKGDWRSGYYRDQTFMFALGAAHARRVLRPALRRHRRRADPWSGGPLDERALRHALPRRRRHWLSSDRRATTSPPTCRRPARRCRASSASPTRRSSIASSPSSERLTQFSRNGDEIALGTIGNASCAEGMFWESINAGGVLQVPMLVSIWDDGYGISVPNEFQITKGNLSELLKGFQRDAEVEAGLRPLHRQRLGLPRALRDLHRRRADRAHGARAGHHPRHRDDAAAGPLDVGQPRALQVERAPGVGESSSTASARCASG